MIFHSHFDRREFLKQGALGLMAATGAGRCFAGQGQPQAARIFPGKVPKVVPGKLDMKWADATLIREAAELHPFDLQRRMELALNAITACVDPNLGYISYSQVHFESQPPHMRHTVGDFVDDMGRHTDALWMIRSATDTRRNHEVVEKMARNAMDAVDDGIAWDPPEFPYVWGPEKDWPKQRWAHLPEVTRVILGLVTYHRATQHDRALNIARSMVHRFYELGEKNERYIWFPDMNYWQAGDKILPQRVALGKKVDVTNPQSGTRALGENQPAAMMGLMLLPVMRYYEDTQDPVAANLVRRFSRLVIDLMPRFGNNIGQTHSSLATTSGILRAGQVFGIPQYMDWAENVYNTFTSLDFIPSFGWTPENTTRPRKIGHLCCETCTSTDYLELALQLAQYRNEKYWDDAERVAMNQLIEGQMLRVDYIERIPLQAIKPLPKTDSKWFTTDHVMNRSLGGFASFCGPNDWLQAEALPFTVQCCYGSGARGLYDVWYYAAKEEGDTVRVNLQFSKRLPSAVVTSYMPGRAALEVKLTQEKKVLVRKPGWAMAEHCKIMINGKEQKTPLRGSYFNFGSLPPGTNVRIEFPDQTVRKRDRMGEGEFDTVWRGNAVIEMHPAGEIYPLYQGRTRQDGVTPLPFVTKSPVNPL